MLFPCFSQVLSQVRFVALKCFSLGQTSSLYADVSRPPAHPVMVTTQRECRAGDLLPDCGGEMFSCLLPLFLSVFFPTGLLLPNIQCFPLTFSPWAGQSDGRCHWESW